MRDLMELSLQFVTSSGKIMPSEVARKSSGSEAGGPTRDTLAVSDIRSVPLTNGKNPSVIPRLPKLPLSDCTALKAFRCSEHEVKNAGHHIM